MKWEYFGYRFFDNKELSILDYRMSIFRDLGLDGWELVSVDNGIAYFKRPLHTEEMNTGEIDTIKDYKRSSLV